MKAALFCAKIPVVGVATLQLGLTGYFIGAIGAPTLHRYSTTNQKKCQYKGKEKSTNPAPPSLDGRGGGKGETIAVAVPPQTIAQNSYFVARIARF